MGKTSISWTDRTWNPVVGCDRVSPGCAHCYAKALHDKRHKAFMAGKDVPDQYSVPFETVQFKPERLDYPLRWREPQRIFVNSVSDLFHESVPVEYIALVFDIMACATLACKHHRWADHTAECWTGDPHTFQILTKRPERMRKVLTEELPELVFNTWPGDSPLSIAMEATWPLPNVWLGVSVENQHFADERIPLLLQTPAAVRFLSCEPLLGPVDLSGYMPEYDHRMSYGYFRTLYGVPEDHPPIPPTLITPGVGWVIVGGESGPGFSPMDLQWARDLRDQCVDANVAFFFKQQAAFRNEQAPHIDGMMWRQFPGDLTVPTPYEVSA